MTAGRTWEYLFILRPAYVMLARLSIIAADYSNERGVGICPQGPQIVED